nr:MAG TPA: hypothetical protein [Caudoviricetes sp.]
MCTARTLSDTGKAPFLSEFAVLLKVHHTEFLSASVPEYRSECSLPTP